MDQAIRNKLRSVVTQCRRLLEESIAQQLQGRYDIYATGKKDEVRAEKDVPLEHLSDEERQARRDILAHFEHITALGYRPREALEQLIREIAFTHLNRLCAYKMMEVRDVYVGGQRFREAVSKGLKSQGFLFYLADHPEDERRFNAGQQEEAYRHFLNWLGGTLSQEIGVLFSPTDPSNRVYPPQRVLDGVLDLLNSEELKGIWSEDETIGWVYQYFTPKELRDQARKESQAPRNSYELAFRNQFFTPRYVVEFLTDNTLGRIWYEMRRGNTRLKDEGRYMVRRPSEVFLAEGHAPPEEPAEGNSDLSQEQLLKRPVHIPHRPKKDPREIKILDPACGSGHFLLYAFSLLLTIYEEAYDDPDLGPGLQADYPTKGDLRRAIPGLILRHNLHGIDIDLRCTQIAALALWLRCQRAYQEMGLKKDRPPILKANVVCAEPMPGEEGLLDEFLKTLREDRLEALIRQVMNVPKDQRVRATRGMVESLSDLVRTVWDKMRLAGEAGSLLKIEEDLQAAIRKGQDEWEERLPLFRFTEYGLSEKPKERLVRFVPGDIEGEPVTFWDKAETLVRRALDEFVSFASNGGRFQRQLFVEDAEQGLGFVDVSRQHHDVVLMNPPFGEPSKQSKGYLERVYRRTKNDVYAAFVERGLGLLHRGGMLGAITSRTGFFLSSFQKWREELLLEESYPTALADLGYGVLDTALVETAAYCLEAGRPKGGSFFIRLLHYGEKGEALLKGVRHHQDGLHHQDVNILDVQSFRQITGSPFSYWVSDPVRRLFRDLPPLESDDRKVRQGLATADDFRFVRLWFEVRPTQVVSGSGQTQPSDFRQQTFEGKRWASFAKGGEYNPYHADLHLVVDWADNGRSIREFDKAYIRNEVDYFRPGLTWPRRSTSGFGLRVLQAGAIFADKGPACFVPEGTELATLGVLFSQSYQRLIEINLAAGEETQSGTAGRSYEVGLIQRLPWPSLTTADVALLTGEVRTLVECMRKADVVDETSRCFIRPVAVLTPGIQQAADNWQRHREAAQVQAIERAASIEGMVSERLFDGQISPLPLTTGDARSLVSLSDGEVPDGFNQTYCRSIHETIREELDEGGGNRQIAVKSFYVSRHIEVLAQTLGLHPRRLVQVAADRHILPEGSLRAAAEDLLSYCSGCVVGRWDVRLATGDRPVPELPQPFDPLPVCSPGVLQGPDGLPVTQAPVGYPHRIDWDGILVDDPDHHDDIIRRVREVLEVIWKDRADAIEKEVCEILGVADLRDYFRKPGAGGFWDDHIKRYSKSRRKAPIYWLIQSSKKNYALWVYYHRLDKDILFKALLNYVEPKLRKEEARLGELRSQKASLGPAARGAKKFDKEIDRQEAFLSELRDFEDKLRRAANLHLEPDLNDGVVLNIAPLRELVPWKEAKSYWDDLMDGKYEWSSIAKQLREKGLVP